MFLLLKFLCGTPPSCLKIRGRWVGGGLQHFSVSPRPLGFGFGIKGLGPGLDNTSFAFYFNFNKTFKAHIITVVHIHRSEPYSITIQTLHNIARWWRCPVHRRWVQWRPHHLIIRVVTIFIDKAWVKKFQSFVVVFPYCEDDQRLKLLCSILMYTCRKLNCLKKTNIFIFYSNFKLSLLYFTRFSI